MPPYKKPEDAPPPKPTRPGKGSGRGRPSTLFGVPLDRQRLHRLERRQLVAALYLEGRSIAQIAEVVGYTVGTVYDDLTEVRKDWLRESLQHYDERKARELAKIDNLEAEAWEAWHRSCDELSVERTRTESVRQVAPGSLPGGRHRAPPAGTKGRIPLTHVLVPVRTSTETVTKGQTGDPRFLEQIAWCIETRLKVMGALRPDTTNVQVNQINWGDMTVRPASPTVLEDVIDAVERESHVTRPLTDGTGSADPEP